MLYQKRKKSCKRLAVGADKGYDTRDFVWGPARDESCRMWRRTIGIARARSMAGPYGTAVIRSARRSYWVEKPFGWLKTVGPLRKVKLRGRDKLWWLLTITAAAFNLWRPPKLQAAACWHGLRQASADFKTAPQNRCFPSFPLKLESHDDIRSSL